MHYHEIKFEINTPTLHANTIQSPLFCCCDRFCVLGHTLKLK